MAKVYSTLPKDDGPQKCTAVRTEVAVTLVLTEDETATLLAVLGRVSGHPEASDRKLIDNIVFALHQAGCGAGVAADYVAPGQTLHIRNRQGSNS